MNPNLPTYHGDDRDTERELDGRDADRNGKAARLKGRPKPAKPSNLLCLLKLANPSAVRMARR